jgi:tripartite-type tricarboxylate transporter receptor subunit TctC
MNQKLALIAAACNAALLGVLVVTTTPLKAQDYPNKPIRVVVPFATGGMLDSSARVITDRLAARLGQQVFIENRGGAAGNVGHDFVAKAAPDGYTVLVAVDGTMAINPHIYKKMNWDPFKDFAPITKLNDATFLLVAHPSFPYNNLRELIANSKQAGRLPFGTAGTATTQHVAGELLKQRTGLDLVHVPYKGGAPAIADVVGGQLSLSYTAIASGSSFVKAGKLKALGISSLQRSAALPDVPTFIESGVPGFTAESWIALFAPAGTPRPIIDRLQRDVAAVLALPEVRERYSALGLLPGGGSPEQLAAQLKEDYTRWEKVIREAGIKIE